jgi:hypothetical protein
MFDEHQKGRVPISITPPAITFAAGCAGLTISIGLCGIGLSTRGASHIHVLPLAIFLLGASVLAIVISIPWFIVVFIMNATRK